MVSRRYGCQRNRLRTAQKTVHPPKGLTEKQTQKQLNKQAILYEREIKRTPGEPVDRNSTQTHYERAGLNKDVLRGFCDALRIRLEDRRTSRSVPFPVSWTVKKKKKQKETQDILSYHTQAAGCSDKARAKASGGRQPIEECGRTGL